MSKVSIIVPVYNSKKYLDRTIQCVLNQTFTDFELILIDDGSTDGCALICDEWERKDNRIVVKHQENQGIGAARNAGLDLATGEYIGFLDHDDMIHPQMFEVLLAHAIAENADVAMIEAAKVSENYEIPFSRYVAQDIKSEN